MQHICVIGLGYVGTVSAACFADMGNHVVGVDIDASKVTEIANARSPLLEAGLSDIIANNIRNARLSAVTDLAAAVRASDVSMICVGTPGRADGLPDTQALETVLHAVGEALRGSSKFHAVVIRSTIPPGTTRNLALPILEAATGGILGEDFGLATNPEFMREGSAVADFYNPPNTVIGEVDAKTADLVERLYAPIEAPLIRTSVEIAEMIKYVNNSWHAVKIAFANEIGSICKQVGIDSHALMDIFCADHKLNISSAYLKPGFAFGGSCLPKDVNALAAVGKQHDLSLPLLGHVIASNDAHIARTTDWVLASGAKRIAILGFTFKPGTDDLRGSPYLEMADLFVSTGREVRLYDTHVTSSNFNVVDHHNGTGNGSLRRLQPCVAATIDAAMQDAELIVVTAQSEEYRAALSTASPHQTVLDIARLSDPRVAPGPYHGLAW